jgi:bacillithiol biosynthesis cysteine-adding enzyme BshC
MQKFTFDRRQTSFFTDQQNTLINGQDELLPFINHTFSKLNFLKQIEEKRANYPDHNRSVLANQLKKAYEGFELTEKLTNHLDALSSKRTFTITAGHQLNILTGPIYVIYKILDVIKMCDELNAEYDEYFFVPCFWMASEDHDFEEIASTSIFSQNFYWSTEQKGAVGKFNTIGLNEIVEEVKMLFQNATSENIYKLLQRYEGETLAEAHFKLFHEIFKEYGLVIIDADKKELKELFIPVLKKEIQEQFSYNCLKSTNALIEKNGLKTQVNPREINLFYLSENSRERVLHLEDDFFIEGKGRLTKEEILLEIEAFPERFSPNVVLRPLYQEIILPNLCYVGGVGELSYWIQLKGIFDLTHVTYPMIKPRSSILWVDGNNVKKMQKVNMVFEDLFSDAFSVKKQYLMTHSSDEIDFDFSDKAFNEMLWYLEEKSKIMDVNTEKLIAAEGVKLAKHYNYIKEKLIKSVRQKHDKDLSTIDYIFEKLFPNGGLQERKFSILSMCSDGDLESRIAQLYKCIEPFSSDFLIVRE